MKNRFAQGATVREQRMRDLFETYYGVSGGNLGVNYDIRPTDDALVVIAGEGGGYEGHAMRFGLWEPWMEGKRLSTLNARSETLDEKRLFAQGRRTSENRLL